MKKFNKTASKYANILRFFTIIALGILGALMLILMFSQLFAIEQPSMLKEYRSLLQEYEIELVTPLLELESDYDRKIELLIRGINPTVIEPQCHFGVPMKKPLTKEEELEVSHLYQEELKPKCLKLIKMSENIPLDPMGKLY